MNGRSSGIPTAFPFAGFADAFVNRIIDGGWFTFGAISYSRNGLWIGAGAGRGNTRKNGSVTVFDVASGDEVWVALKKHEDYVYTVEFGARDRSILSGSGEGVCYIWDTQLPPNDDDLEYLKTVDDGRNEADFQDLVGFSGTKPTRCMVNISQTRIWPAR